MGRPYIFYELHAWGRLIFQSQGFLIHTLHINVYVERADQKPLNWEDGGAYAYMYIEVNKTRKYGRIVSPNEFFRAHNLILIYKKIQIQTLNIVPKEMMLYFKEFYCQFSTR